MKKLLIIAGCIMFFIIFIYMSLYYMVYQDCINSEDVDEIAYCVGVKYIRHDSALTYLRNKKYLMQEYNSAFNAYYAIVFLEYPEPVTLDTTEDKKWIIQFLEKCKDNNKDCYLSLHDLELRGIYKLKEN